MSDKDEKPKYDTQSDKYLLTINNPVEYGYTHEKILKTLVDNFKTFSYLAMADEKGSTFHTHALVCFHSRVRFSTIKKHFCEAHIDKVKGAVSQCIEYLEKGGKWEDTDKAETRIDGSFQEYGDRPPDSKGKRSDMSELYRMVADGMTNAEILATNQDYILQIDKIDKVRTTILTEKYKGTRRLDLKVIYISGATGTGKTRGILDDHGDTNVYRVTDYLHPFDGYSCQPVLVFDEFRSSLMLKDMLNYTDIYPLELPARFANKYACYEHVYIVSNWELEKQYSELQKEDQESWKAFLRRIHEVHIYDESGNVTKYHSVKEYMERQENFYEPTEEELKNCPFVID